MSSEGVSVYNDTLVKTFTNPSVTVILITGHACSSYCDMYNNPYKALNPKFNGKREHCFTAITAWSIDVTLPSAS